MSRRGLFNDEFYESPLERLEKKELISRIEKLQKDVEAAEKAKKAAEAATEEAKKAATPDLAKKLQAAKAENDELYKKLEEAQKKLAEASKASPAKTPTPASGPEIDRSILSKAGKEEYDALIDTLVTAGEKKEKLSRESEKRLKAKRAISSL